MTTSTGLAFCAESRAVEVQGLKPACKVFPRLALQRSRIPTAGYGVFATTPIERGSFVTEYGGELIGWDTALERRDRDIASHIRGLSHGLDALDSSPLPGDAEQKFTLAYYASHHLLGGFINDFYGTNSAANVTYYFHDKGKEYAPGFHAHENATQTYYSSGRVFIKALCNILPGEELLVNYDTTYRKLEFT